MVAAASYAEQPQWQALPEMPVAVAAPAVSVAGHKAVVSGGVVLGSGASNVVQVLDLDTLTWTLTSPLQTPRYQHAQVTLHDGRVLIVGGRTRLPAKRPDATASCEVLSADFSQSTPTADLPQPSQSPTLHLLADGRVAAVGVMTVSVFDPVEGTWAVVTPLHQPRREHASLLLEDGTILVGGGIGRSTFERVDLAGGKPELLDAHLPTGLDDLAMVLLPDGRIWVLGGQSIDGQTTDHSWILTLDESGRVGIEDGPNIGEPNGVADHIVLPVDGGYVMVGGESQNGSHDTELAEAFWLDPVGLTIRRLAPTPIAHDDAAGFVDGRSVVVLGGQVKAPFLGVPVPTPIRAVHRLVFEPSALSP